MLTRKQAVFFCFTEFEKLLEKDIWSSPNFHEMEKVAAICTFSYFCPLKEDEIIVIFQQIPYWLTLPSGSTTGMRPSEGILASTRFPSWSLTGTAAPWESEWLQSRKGTRKGFLGLTHRGAALGAHCTHAMKKWKKSPREWHRQRPTLNWKTGRTNRRGHFVITPNQGSFSKARLWMQPPTHTTPTPAGS